MTKRTAESLPTFGHAIVAVVIPSTLHTNPEPQPNANQQTTNTHTGDSSPQTVFRANPPIFWDVVGYVAPKREGCTTTNTI